MSKKITNIMKNLSNIYFQGIADDISNAKQISSIFPNMSDVGDIRENILLKFLQSHIPLRSEVVKGGFIFDSEGNCSKQIDLIVVSDSALKFSYFDRSAANSKCIQTVEGTLAAISVKSTLKNDTLKDALDNLASIPRMSGRVVKITMAKNPRDYFRFPYKVLFAYTSNITPEVALNKINTFYNNKNMGAYQMLDLLVVNNAYYIVRNNESEKEKISYSLGVPLAQHEDSKGASPLFFLLRGLHATTTWAPQAIFDYTPYSEAMDLY